MLQGIDVSSAQGDIDWGKVAASGIAFAIIKASESTDYLNPFLVSQYHGARSANLVTGLYHFARPSRNNGHMEASYFLNAIGATGGLQRGDFLALDLEDDGVEPTADLLAYTLDFLDTVYRAVGFRPYLYSGNYYLDPHNLEGHPDTLGQYPLWLASWQANVPPTPSGWARIALWQFSSTGTVPGVQGDCDLDAYAGTAEQLRQTGWGNIPSPLQGQPVDPPPTVAVNASGEAVDVNKAAQTISAQALAIYWQLSTLDPKRPDQAAAAMSLKANADAIVKVSGLLS